MHAWPCAPHYQQRVRLAEAPWTDLSRCEGCGSLWEAMDRGWKRLTVEVARFERPDLGGPQSILGVHLSLNQGALHRIIVITDQGHWQVGERGALMWIFWKDLDALVPTTPDEAIVLAGDEWGAPAGAALRLALDSGFDPRQLGALELAQAFEREDWSRPWQPRSVGIVDAMFTAGTEAQARIDAAFRFARRAGMIVDDDIVAAGFAPPAPRALGGADSLMS
jgi:hypothetical protein